jgi:sugar/nucleoside kinase (ribokinase family)
MNGRQVVVAGHICVDLVPRIESSSEESMLASLLPGRTLHVGPLTMIPGGAVANVGIALSRLGVDTVLVARRGTDSLGETLPALLTHAAPQARLALTNDHDLGTSYSVIVSRPGSDRIILQHPGANDAFTALDLDPALLASCALLHFGYPQVMRSAYHDGGTMVRDLFSRARRAGVATSLDLTIADPDSEAARADWSRFLKRVLPETDIFAPSIAELREALGTDDDADAIALRCVDLGAGVVAVKLGSDGLLVRSGSANALSASPLRRVVRIDEWAGRRIAQPAFPVAVRNTLGAGDTAIAGLLAGVIAGRSIEESSRLAAAAGAWSVESGHTHATLPSLETLDRRLAGEWH